MKKSLPSSEVVDNSANNEHLLTPPLTPATSLRNHSIGTTESNDTDTSFGSSSEPDSTSATRFLLVSFIHHLAPII
jgi:hypothetical protein